MQERHLPATTGKSWLGNILAPSTYTSVYSRFVDIFVQRNNPQARLISNTSPRIKLQHIPASGRVGCFLCSSDADAGEAAAAPPEGAAGGRRHRSVGAAGGRHRRRPSRRCSCCHVAGKISSLLLFLAYTSILTSLFLISVGSCGAGLSGGRNMVEPRSSKNRSPWPSKNLNTSHKNSSPSNNTTSTHHTLWSLAEAAELRIYCDS